MSNEALNRVWASAWDNNADGGASHRLTLIALADMTNPAGFCWSSLDKLVEKVQAVKRRQLITVLARLEEGGKIAILRRVKQQGRNGINYYVVLTGLDEQTQRAAIHAAEQHAHANGWISAISADISAIERTDNGATGRTNQVGNGAIECTDIEDISAISDTRLVQSSAGISAVFDTVLVQPAAPDPSYDPSYDPIGGNPRAREAAAPQSPTPAPPPLVKVEARIPDRTPGGNGYRPPADPPPQQSPPKGKPLTPEQQAIADMANVLTEVTGVSARLLWGDVGGLAKDLIEAGYTAEQVKTYYGPRKVAEKWHWYEADWRGQKGDKPRLKEIRETIAGAVDAAPARNVTDEDRSQTWLEQSIAMARANGLLPRLAQ